MALTKIFQLYALKCGSTLFHQLQDAPLNTNVTDMTVTPSGHIIPVFTAHNGSRPEVPFTTHQVEAAITLFGLLGGDAGTTILQLQKSANKGNRVAHATSEHVFYTINSALGYGMTIAASNRQQATFQGRLVLLKSGSNAPFIYSGSNAITDTPPTGSESFVLGPISIAGTIIEGTNDMNLALNPTIEEPEDDFQSAPVFACVLNIAPILTFTTTDPSIWSSHETAISGNGVKVNLLRKSANSDVYSDASTEHILLTAASGRIVCESVGGSKSLTRVRIVPISSDGSTLPVTATVNSAVSTT